VSEGLAVRGGCDPETLLSLWEQGLSHPPSARADALLQQDAARSVAPSTLGLRNRRLIDLHARLFGDDLELTSHCPACGATVEFGSRCSALTADAHAGGAPAIERIDADGYAVEFRLPDRADVAAAAAHGDGDAFAKELIHRCVVRAERDGAAAAVTGLPDPVLDAVSRRMEALDPAALLSFALECPECAARWSAPLDVEQLLWTRVQAAAERLLLDVDALARAYGWTEQEVLALAPARRAAYLQLAGA
jgi:hypothetical protein